MRFIGTKRFSPVIYEADLPWKQDPYHLGFKAIPKSRKRMTEMMKSRGLQVDKRWWEKQYQRCINGYTVENAIEPGGDNYRDGTEAIWDGDDCYLKELDYTIKGRSVHISGRMYFYLNFWSIKRLDAKLRRKIVGNPRFTDLSWENWTVREMSSQTQLDDMWVKARQKGFSEEESCDTAYDYIFLRDSQSVIVSGEEKYSLNSMRMVRRGIERLLHTQFYVYSTPDSVEYMFSPKKGSELYCRTAKDNAQAVSSLTPSKVKFEETGIWKKGMILEAAEFIRASAQAEGEKTSKFTFIGTGGDIEDGVWDMEKMVYNPDSYGLMSFPNMHEDETTENERIARFVPAWKFRVIDEDGNSLREKSLISLEKEASMKKTAKERVRFWTQNPRKLSDVFAITSGTYFPEETRLLLNARYSFLVTHKAQQKGERGVLKWRDSRNTKLGVEFEPSEDGWITIFEHPETDENGEVFLNLYGASTDSYDMDETMSSDSKGSSRVFKKFNKERPFSSSRKWVASITERPKADEGGSYLFYEHTAMMCVYYGWCVNLIEWSKWRIVDWYRSNGFTRLLKERPDMVISTMIDNSQATNKYGIDPSSKHSWLSMLTDALTYEFIQNMDDIEQIKALTRFKLSPKYNCDITISSALSIVLEKDEELIQVKSKKSSEQRRRPMAFVERNGYIVMQ